MREEVLWSPLFSLKMHVAFDKRISAYSNIFNELRNFPDELLFMIMKEDLQLDEAEKESCFGASRAFEYIEKSVVNSFEIG